MFKKNILIIAFSFIALAILSRLMIHQPNFAPLAAIALVSGFYLKGKYSWAIPLVAVLASDALLGFYNPGVMAAVYGSYLLAWFLASRSSKVSSLIPTTLVSSVFFFVATNGAVWAFTKLYSPDLAGLWQSYAMGLPFFKWTLLSDVLFTSAFVAVFEVAKAKSFISLEEKAVEGVK